MAAGNRPTPIVRVAALAVLGALGGLAVALLSKNLPPRPTLAPSPAVTSAPTLVPSPTPTFPSSPTPAPTPTAVEGLSDPARVPFTAQAPTGNWGDPLYQNGCEEATLLMAMRWVEGKTALAPEEALEEMRAIAAFSDGLIGQSVDQSARDTARLFREYAGHPTVEAVADIGVADIRAAVGQGNLVIVPVDGRKLGNSYYRVPGPPRHMLVVIGYDPAGREFITHDPGTRHGKGYRYAEAILSAALRDYPTGDHLPILLPSRTAMIVVQPR